MSSTTLTRLTTTKAVAITVTNVNEAPTITSGDAASFAENGTGIVYAVAVKRLARSEN